MLDRFQMIPHSVNLVTFSSLFAGEFFPDQLVGHHDGLQRVGIKSFLPGTVVVTKT